MHYEIMHGCGWTLGGLLFGPVRPLEKLYDLSQNSSVSWHPLEVKGYPIRYLTPAFLSCAWMDAERVLDCPLP